MTPDDAAKTVQAHCEDWSPGYSFFGKDTRAFIGSVDEYSFKMHRAIRYGNSFLPVLVGYIVPKGDASEVQITMRMPVFTSIFMFFWFSFFVWDLVSRPPTLDEIKSWISVGFIVSGYIFVQLAFWLEVPKAEKGIRRVFASES